MKTLSEMRQELAAKAAGDDGFRKSLIADPKGVIAKEYGIQLPESVKIAVHEDSNAAAHLILPPSAALGDETLAQIAGGQFGAGSVDEYGRMMGNNNNNEDASS